MRQWNYSITHRRPASGATVAARAATATLAVTATLAAAILVAAGPTPAVAAGPHPAAVLEYTLVDLGKLGRDADGLAINADAEVVGSYYTLGEGSRPFLWSMARTGGAIQALPGLPCATCTAGATRAISANAITDAGDIAGTAEGLDGQQHAVLWSDGAVYDLGRFADSLEVTGMNESGTVIANGIVGTERRAFVHQPGTDWRDLAPDLAYAQAHDINDAGQIAGECGQDLSDHAACLWAADGGYQVVATGGPGYDAEAYGLNDRGVVVGTYGDAYRHSTPFRWDGGMLTALADPTLPTGGALDINNAGVVIGGYGLRASTPAVWRDGVMIDLPAYGVGPRAGSALPRDINDAGVITGDSGTPEDPWHHAVIWVPSTI